jgi:hypothetical protein
MDVDNQYRNGKITVQGGTLAFSLTGVAVAPNDLGRARSQ